MAGQYTLVMSALAIAGFAAAGTAQATVYSSAFGFDTASEGFYFKGYNIRYPLVDRRDMGLFGPTMGGAPCGGCLATSSGTVAPGTDATSSFDQLTLANATGRVSTAYGRADLRTGEIGVSATGTTYQQGGYNYAVEGEALGGIGDGLNFTIAGASAGTVTEIGVTVDLHGHMEGTSFLQEQLLFRSAGYSDAQFINQIRSEVGSPAHFQYTNAGGWLSYSFEPYTPDHSVFQGVYALTGAFQHVDFGEVLLADSSGGYSDYAHTSNISLTLPSNVTYSSESGAFLMGVGGVPEPTTWTLLVAGFGLCGAAFRRRQRAATVTARRC